MMYIFLLSKKIKLSELLNTNASLLTRKKIIQLAKDGVTALKIGIDSVSGKMTKPCMNMTKNYLDIVKDNIIFAKEIIPDTSIDVVLSEFNKDTVDEVIGFIIEHKLSNSIFIYLNLIKEGSKLKAVEYLISKYKAFTKEDFFEKYDKIDKMREIYDDAKPMKYAIEICD